MMEFLLAGCVVLFLLFVVIRVLLRLTYGLRGPEKDDFIYALLNVMSWTFFILALGMGLIVSAGGPLSILVWGFALVTALSAWGKHRAMQRRALLALLAVATEKSLPLGPALTSFDDGHAGSVGAGARRMANLLEHGMPLIDAMKRCSYSLPRYALPFAREGMTIDALTPALREANKVRTAGQQLWESTSGRLIYLFVILFAGMWIGTITMIKIVPSLVEIFDDFELDLPNMTLLLVDVSDAFVLWGWMFIVPLFFLLMAVLVIGGLGQLFQFDWLDRLPGLGILSNGTHVAVVLRSLAIATERGQPLDRALRPLAGSYSPRPISRRLIHVADDVARGEDWCQSMRRLRLISQTELALLKSAERAGNLPWALRMVADRRARRFAYRLQVLFQIVSPIVVLLLGACVMFFVVSLFIPLIDLIANLSQ